jgi:hypothetical protein
MIFSSTATLADTRCSRETLRGKYLYVYNGSMVNGSQKVAFASSGYEIYYGNGRGRGVYEYTDDTGAVWEGVSYSLTYTVKPDCSGTATLTEDVSRAQMNYVNHIDPTGNTFTFIQTSPRWTVAAGTEHRVSTDVTE